MRRSGVLFDLGGVVLGSPLQAIRDYEAELGFERNAINRVAASRAPTAAWGRLERGELDLESFYPAFESDCRAAGLSIDARDMMQRMADAAGPRDVMLRAIRRLRDAAFRVGALTNNWAQANSSRAEAEHPARSREDDDRANPDDGTRAIRSYFDVFIESSVEGLRKPDPAIYHLACERLARAPEELVFLDDIGANLKPARALGMATIKVEQPESALAELSELVELDLLGDVV